MHMCCWYGQPQVAGVRTHPCSTTGNGETPGGVLETGIGALQPQDSGCGWPLQHVPTTRTGLLGLDCLQVSQVSLRG
jgi:hypothetical protein